MTSDEQRRAFAEYMGTANQANQANQLGPYTSGLAGQQQQQQQQQHYNQVGAPPSAFQYLGRSMLNDSLAACSPGQYQSLQPPQGLQGFGSLQVPPAAPTPPAATASLAQASAGGFSMPPPPPRPPGYVQLPRHFVPPAPPPPLGQYNPGWQYNNPMASSSSQANQPFPQAVQGQMLQTRTQETSQHSYQYDFPNPPPLVAQDMQNAQEVNNVPVLLCHTCRECGRMRSAGYHRHNPVIPGQPLVTSVCRRCKRKSKKYHRHRSTSVTRIRTCKSEKPCDWPDEDIRIRVRGDDRGRRQDNVDADVFVVRYRSRSHDYVVNRNESQTRIGLGVLQEERNPPRALRRKTEVRVQSVSPPPELRYRRIVEVGPSPIARSPHRHAEEDVPSSPPICRTSQRIVYESESEDPSSANYPPPRSPSLVRLRVRHNRGREDAEARLAAHPAPYRPVLPDQRAFYQVSDDTSSIEDPAPPSMPESPSRGILKTPGRNHETLYRRHMSMRESEESNLVEIGGPRVQFSRRPASRRDDRSALAPAQDNVEFRYRHARREYHKDPSTSPPLDGLERMSIRHDPPPRRYEERRRSPSPIRRIQDVGKARYRHTSPPPPTRGREIAHTRPILRSASESPPRQNPKEKDWEDVTDSGSEQGDLVEMREWRGYDENGRPATWVEERRRVRLLEQGMESETDFRRPSMATRAFREV